MLRGFDRFSWGWSENVLSERGILKAIEIFLKKIKVKKITFYLYISWDSFPPIIDRIVDFPAVWEPIADTTLKLGLGLRNSCKSSILFQKLIFSKFWYIQKINRTHDNILHQIHRIVDEFDPVFHRLTRLRRHLRGFRRPDVLSFISRSHLTRSELESYSNPLLKFNFSIKNILFYWKMTFFICFSRIIISLHLLSAGLALVGSFSSGLGEGWLEVEAGSSSLCLVNNWIGPVTLRERPGESGTELSSLF